MGTIMRGLFPLSLPGPDLFGGDLFDAAGLGVEGAPVGIGQGVGQHQPGNGHPGDGHRIVSCGRLLVIAAAAVTVRVGATAVAGAAAAAIITAVSVLFFLIQFGGGHFSSSFQIFFKIFF